MMVTAQGAHLFPHTQFSNNTALRTSVDTKFGSTTVFWTPVDTIDVVGEVQAGANALERGDFVLSAAARMDRMDRVETFFEALESHRSWRVNGQSLAEKLKRHILGTAERKHSLTEPEIDFLKTFGQFDTVSDIAAPSNTNIRRALVQVAFEKALTQLGEPLDTARLLRFFIECPIPTVDQVWQVSHHLAPQDVKNLKKVGILKADGEFSDQAYTVMRDFSGWTPESKFHLRP